MTVSSSVQRAKRDLEAMASKQSVILRDYQSDGVEKVLNTFRNAAQGHSGCARILYVLSTGAGKTSVAVEIMRRVQGGERMLFIVHRKELLNQAVKRLVKMGFCETEIGVLMGKDHRARPDARIQVATIQTLVRRKPLPPAELVVFDEGHHAAAKSWRAVADAYPTAYKLGLTATPWGPNGGDLSSVWDHMVLGPPMSALIEAGWLSAPRAWSTPHEGPGVPDLTKIKIVKGDYAKGELSRAMNKPTLVGSLVDHYIRLGGGERGVVYAIDIEHGESFVTQFRAAGISCEMLSYKTPDDERDEILARLESGETRIVVNVEVLTEGWDMPAVKVCICARPTKSIVLWLQMVGRFLRPWNDVTPILLDHAGNVGELGMPQDEREYALEKRFRKPGQAPRKLCPSCDEWVAISARVCPGCGHEFWGENEDEPMHGDGELEEVQRGACSDCGNAQITRGAKRCKDCNYRSKRTLPRECVNGCGRGIRPNSRNSGMCKPCSHSLLAAAMSPEERAAAGARLNASITPEQRRLAGIKSITKLGADGLAKRVAVMTAALPPERRAEIGRSVAAGRTAEERSKAARHAGSFRSESGKKHSGSGKWDKMTQAQRESWVAKMHRGRAVRRASDSRWPKS